MHTRVLPKTQFSCCAGKKRFENYQFIFRLVGETLPKITHLERHESGVGAVLHDPATPTHVGVAPDIRVVDDAGRSASLRAEQASVPDRLPAADYVCTRFFFGSARARMQKKK